MKTESSKPKSLAGTLSKNGMRVRIISRQKGTSDVQLGDTGTIIEDGVSFPWVKMDSGVKVVCWMDELAEE